MRRRPTTVRSPDSLGLRLLIVVAVGLVLALLAWDYAGNHDVGATIRELISGKDDVAWPPPERPTSQPVAVPDGIPGMALALLRMLVIVAAGLGGALALHRLGCRWRRIGDLETWELRLGRDDLTNPFKVQEAFEGIAGSLSVRWYQRLWSGQDHLALEIRRVPDGSICFAVAGPHGVERVMRAALKELYPDVTLERRAARPAPFETVLRLKKARSYVLSIHTQRNYEHAFSESLVAALDTAVGTTGVQIVLTPAPRLLHGRSRSLLKRRERRLGQRGSRDHFDGGRRSVVDTKELKGALETQHRSLLYFDLRVFAMHGEDAARIAGLFAQLRSENEFVRRDMHIRRRLFSARIAQALPNLVPSFRTGVLSTSELSTLWQLPRARVKETRLNRSTVRRAIAPPGIDRAAEYHLMRDERGYVGISPGDRKYGHALIGGQGGGKSSVMARSLHAEAHRGDAAIVLYDPKGPLAELALGLVSEGRTVHYLDLAAPEFGFNPLALDASPGARASLVVQALIEANKPGAIQAASDSFLRQAISTVCAVERKPTMWHVYRMLDLHPKARYRQEIAQRLDRVPGTDFARSYWRREFPTLLSGSGFASQALNPPRNKLERLIATPEIDTLLRHPVSLDLRQVIERGEVLIVRGAKAIVGEDNAVFVMQLLLQLLHRAVQAQQSRPEHERRRVSLFIDEAHNLLTPSVATMLAEGRSAGLEAVFAWQYSAQIANEVIRSGLRSLLQSISIFRMREMEDARSIAGLAMEVYSDRISVNLEEQERLRFSADDIVRLPVHRAINLWVADGVPRPGFVAQSLPMEELYDDRLEGHHRSAQRARGGYFPDPLPDPLAGHQDGDPDDASQPELELVSASVARGSTIATRARPAGPARAATFAEDDERPAIPPLMSMFKDIEELD